MAAKHEPMARPVSADDVDPRYRWDRPLQAPGHMQVDFEERVDFRRLHAYRLGRARRALAASGLGAVLVFRDIAERRRLERERAERLALERWERQATELVSAVARSITASLDLDTVLQRIVELGDKKHAVSPEDLPYIIADVLKSPDAQLVHVESYRVAVETGAQPRAEVVLASRRRRVKASAHGDGGYDAFMNALRKAAS